jgi:hypothetical protein
MGDDFGNHAANANHPFARENPSPVWQEKEEARSLNYGIKPFGVAVSRDTFERKPFHYENEYNEVNMNFKHVDLLQQKLLFSKLNSNIILCT